jgi:hypothetical protein
MMEFLLYLNPQSIEIYNLISQKVKFSENAPICYKSDIYGNYNSISNLITICTGSIKKSYATKKYTNETFLHEVVHYAQSCKSRNRTLVPFGINPKAMVLDSEKYITLKEIIAYDYRLKQIDHESLWMSEKPEKVKHSVLKYCF